MKIKYVLIALFSILLLSAAGVCIYMVFTNWNKQPAYEQEPIINVTEDGYTYTRWDWEWKANQQKEPIVYLDDVSGVETRTVTLFLDDYRYYDIVIPDVPVMIDYGKTVSAIDGSFTVRVIEGASEANLSSYAGITNPIAVTKNSLCSSNEKGMRAVACLQEGYAIVAEVYSGDEAYTVLYNSITSQRIPYSLFEEDKSIENSKRVTDLYYHGNFVGQIVFDEVNLNQDIYRFRDGSMWTRSVFESMDSTRELYKDKLVALASTNIEEYYYTSNMYYAKAGNWYIGLVSYNSNTTITFIGYGEEARCNIITLLRDLTSND